MILVWACLAVSACGTIGNPETPTPNGEDPQSGSERSASAAPRSSSTDPQNKELDEKNDATRGDRSPLQGVVPYLQLTAEETGLIGAEVARQRQEHQVLCMRREGFEYVAIDTHQPGFTAVPEDMPATEEEFRERFGYGITFNARLSLAPIETTILDPNDEIVSAMSGNEKARYESALFDCKQESADAIPDPFSVGYMSSALWLSEQLEALKEAVWADARMVKAVATWSRCMAAAGFEFATPDDAQEELWERAQQILEGAGPGLAPEVEAALSELQSLELLVASQDTACSTDLEEVRERVRFELESAFVEQNSHRLAAIEREALQLLEPYSHLTD